MRLVMVAVLEVRGKTVCAPDLFKQSCVCALLTTELYTLKKFCESVIL